ncbi:protein MAIN-LIKE 1-like [Lathyrus oleraceus]|uniref:protein MAIN-LIKE 1-like n=1 Tax=Pisum sativum TaxID=3888 RepID=UPI0021CE32DC|nr:protein MAIN-LIKE 1-like [Pisum sativum]
MYGGRRVNRRQVSPVSPLIVDVVDPLPPFTIAYVDPVPPPEGEAVAGAEPEKFLNHERKINAFTQPNEEWFRSVLSLSGLKDLYMISYTTVNHKMLNELVERWNSETSLFYLPHGEMSITLDDVSCLLHLSIRGRFLDHDRMAKDEAPEIMIEYLGVDPGEAMDELDKIRGAHARFVYLKKVYEDALLSAHQADGDDEPVALHTSYALRVYLLYLVGTTIFMDKSVTYTDVIYEYN